MKTHWKKLVNPDYLGAYSLDELPNQELTLKIKLIEKREIANEGGVKTMPVIIFHNAQKPMILKPKNGRIIEKLLGKHIENWIDKEITLCVKKEFCFGEWHEVLRVKNEKPKQAQQKTEANYQEVIAKIKATKTVEALTELFNGLDATTKAGVKAEATMQKEVLLLNQKNQTNEAVQN